MIDVVRGDVARELQSLRHFRELLASSRTARVPEPALWSAFAQAFPRRPSGPEERAWLLAALELLAADDTLRLPPKRSSRWDRSAAPEVPRSVDLVRAPKPRATEDWRHRVWHPRLAWVPKLRSATPAEIAFLTRVHEGIVRDEFSDLAPIKYRSLALTGDEKRLAALLKTRLFADGRLSLELLNCQADLPPLAWTRVSAGSVVLAFENSGPTDLAIRLFRQLDEQSRIATQVGVVAYGGGTTFAGSVARLADLNPRPTAIWYIGDLDAEGLRIARSASRVAESLALPPVEPAPGFHAAMFNEAAQLARPTGWPHGDTPSTPRKRVSPEGSQLSQSLIQWLPSPVRPKMTSLLQQRRRIPEEVLGPDAMQRLLIALGGHQGAAG